MRDGVLQHPRQRQGIEHRQDLCADRIGRVAIPGRGLVGEAASEQIGAIDAMGFGDRRHPPVPKRRVADKAVHHQHWGRMVPRPQKIVDGAMDRSTFRQDNAGHRQLLRFRV